MKIRNIISRVFAVALAMQGSIAIAAVSETEYQSIIQRVQAACSGGGSGCAAAIASARAQITAAGGTLVATEAQLGGLVSTVASLPAVRSLPPAERRAIVSQIRAIATSVSDTGIRGAAEVVAAAVDNGESAAPGVVAQLGSPN